MYRKNGTMDVLVDGRFETRQVDCFNTEKDRYEPILNPDEEAIWVESGDVPTIVKVR